MESTINTRRRAKSRIHMDMSLLGAIIALVGLGLIMVASASISGAEGETGDPLFYFWRQLETVLLGVILFFLLIRVPVDFWQRHSISILLIGVALLILVLIPGLGRTVNGSTRWLCMGSLCLQVSEFAKFALILYLSGFFVRHSKQLKDKQSYYLVPLMVLAMLGVLLLAEPDYGALVVMVLTVFALLFLRGMKFSSMLLVAMPVVGLLSIALFSEDYRLKRLMSFLDPCSNQNAFDNGYQLCQALIAFGRGGWTGVGLGSSVQKLHYLPEAHTDFLFAVLAEELGLLGSLLVIGLFAILVYRIFIIGMQANEVGKPFAAYTAYGIAFWLGTQAVVNMCVNVGLLPTKGLTLPLMSYGGSSLLIAFLSLAVVVRIDQETQKKLPKNARRGITL